MKGRQTTRSATRRFMGNPKPASPRKLAFRSRVSPTYGAESREQARLHQARLHRVPWRKWGPYLSERQWGTVREDYSANGDAWNYFTHDHARSRAYRWG